MPSKERKARSAALAKGAPKITALPARVEPKEARLDKPARAILDTIGREHLLRVLSSIVPPEDHESPEARLLAYLQSPEHETHSITLLMRNAGLVLPEIIDIVRNHDIAMGMLRAAAHVPDVMEDIAIDAKSSEVTCPTCKGAGAILDVDDEEARKAIEEDPELRELVDQVPCAICDGVGRLRRIGDADSRRILLKSLGMIDNKPAVAIQNNKQIVNNYGQPAGAGPEDVSKRVELLLGGK